MHRRLKGRMEPQNSNVPQTLYWPPIIRVRALCSNTCLNLKSLQLHHKEVSGDSIHSLAPGRSQEETHTLGLKPHFIKIFTYCQQWSRGDPGIPTKGSEWGKFQASPNFLTSVSKNEVGAPNTHCSLQPHYYCLPWVHQGLFSLERDLCVFIYVSHHKKPRLLSHHSSCPLLSLIASGHPPFYPYLPCFPNFWNLSTVAFRIHMYHHQKNFISSKPPFCVHPSSSYSKGYLSFLAVVDSLQLSDHGCLLSYKVGYDSSLFPIDTSKPLPLSPP